MTDVGQHWRERIFHDAWADGTALDRIDVRAAFEHPTAVENRFILSQLGDLRGARLLDIGAGLGEASVYFALQGAVVTACDVSPGMLTFVTELARRHGVTIDTLLLDEGSFQFGTSAFDVVYGANVLHHVGDIARCLDGVGRALAPGGQCMFMDPLSYNPVIWVYRWLARRLHTDDEHPVSFDVFSLMAQRFDDVGHREFWILSQALFLKFFLVDRLHPGRVRYWKHIYEEDPRQLERWWVPLREIDEYLLRVPGLRRMAWNSVYWGRKRSADR